MAKKRLFVSYITAAGSVCDLGLVKMVHIPCSPRFGKLAGTWLRKADR